MSSSDGITFPVKCVTAIPNKSEKIAAIFLLSITDIKFSPRIQRASLISIILGSRPSPIMPHAPQSKGLEVNEFTR
jgi:hypothetical protein